ncbi:DUF2917 domain-containing protein [Paraburkholderia sp. CNPSo 3157]|uniref:DUF2917 domain-containing protein n=1 Tax=Paraburkholderia franconis TaxID=2654983 RepID=A0A7X1N6U7_9BURK|nr:DUF2917 domain-containing protein [Paraburkholderia franconis]MPW16442.1 DUF2917 domain-containing protein [Paraburkholderia franconis]
MDKVCQQFTDDDSLCSSRLQEERLPRVVVHFEVQPGATMSWRVEANTELFVQGARVWLTRAASPYDHWLQIGDTFRLQRGERVWVSTDGDAAARLSLTTHLVTSRGMLARLMERCASLGADIFAPRSR